MSIFSIDDVSSRNETPVGSSIKPVTNQSSSQINDMPQASKLDHKFAWSRPVKSNPSLGICQHQQYGQTANGETQNSSRNTLEHLIPHTLAGGSAANTSNAASGPNNVAIGEVRLHTKVMAKLARVFKSCVCFSRNQL